MFLPVNNLLTIIMIEDNQTAFQEAITIFRDGGPVMAALGVVAVILYGTCIATILFLNRGNLNKKEQEKWDGWIAKPDSAEGRIGEAIQYAIHGPKVTISVVQRRMQEVFEKVVSRIDRRLIFIGALIAIAPMTGLLGTVGGMLSMFDGLAGGNGEQGAKKIAEGMKEALFTTLTGLVVSLPGMFLALYIKVKRDAIASTITGLQSAIVKTKFSKL